MAVERASERRRLLVSRAVALIRCGISHERALIALVFGIGPYRSRIERDVRGRTVHRHYPRALRYVHVVARLYIRSILVCPIGFAWAYGLFV